MTRICGIDVPSDKRAIVSLTYIYGVGKTSSQKILHEARIDKNIRMKSLSEEQVSSLSTIIDKHYRIEGTLRREIAQNIQRLKTIGSYRGMRHRKGLPVRGQRTSSNARTRKGPRKTVAVRKSSMEKT